mmetsp:Transcript_22598/g.50257  ORF Transcript_22598/g.50257 Transcript_22598/m.50257 type:complete len:80 (+) Transcript_22598:34-273(+)
MIDFGLEPHCIASDPPLRYPHTVASFDKKKNAAEVCRSCPSEIVASSSKREITFPRTNQCMSNLLTTTSKHRRGNSDRF